ncbi:hypothetical protein FHS31_001484 [Sphingomonas vulcanisoli]|uniref:C-type lysozyme inhibitor domain-containing protein n=1 Tax=Sphingomonas vulcanisoli TaxID=1658060 RepID=A0ABX0TSZ7_9SPHN|nr:hypothetical protein [Sphingomonas vulcanisoli]NIJ07874.1 hypothetical protein [Sphingomonas vulcanisoli]
MMKKALAAAALSATVLLAACGEPTTITAGAPNDPTADQVAAAPKVKLPPAMLASKTYRCQPGNEVLYVNWFNDNTSANIKKKKEDTPVALTAPAKGEPFSGGGYVVKGSADSAKVTITPPGGKDLECSA